MRGKTMKTWRLENFCDFTKATLIVAERAEKLKEPVLQTSLSL